MVDFLQKRLSDTRGWLDDSQDVSMMKLPTKEEIAEALMDLLSVLREDPTQGALRLQKLIGKIKVYDMVFPGKKRGYARLEFLFNPVKFIGVDDRVNFPDEQSAPEDVVLYTGEPTKLERLLPQIHEWVSLGMPWKEIQRRTGLSICGTNMYYKRWLEATSVTKPNDRVAEERSTPKVEEDTTQSAS